MSNTPFKIYNASAGSGKTFSLVRDYLCLLFSSKTLDAYKHILAITFTNKAVAEMKSRIIKTLIAFSQTTIEHNYLNMFNDIISLTGLDAKTIQSNSKRILKHIIHNYAAFEVSTIDGFTHRIIRTFSKDLNLPSNFEVTTATVDVLQEAVDRLIAKAGENKALTKILLNFVFSKIDDDKSWNISKEFLETAKLLANETNLKHLKAIEHCSLKDFEEYSIYLSKEKTQLITALNRCAQDVFNIIKVEGIDPIHAFKGNYAHIFFTHLLNGNVFNLNLDKVWQNDLLDASKPLYAKSSKHLTSTQKESLDVLKPQIAEYFSTVKEHIFKLYFIEKVSKNLVPLSVLNIINQAVENIKKERSLVLISEFNQTIFKAIAGQPVPFIYERLGERYRHFFIDEFQDTSVLQWHNLIPLIDNALSGQDDQKNQGSLLLVGDAKQSIYRWRGGKAEQFIDLCKTLSPFVAIPKVDILPNNYRSLPEIVNFNNSLFKYLASIFSIDDYKAVYNDSKQEPKKQNQGYVNLTFYEVPNVEEKNLIYPEEIYTTITQCEQLGYQKSDICILYKRHKQGTAIANYLSEKGIPLISSSTLLVKNSKDVLAILNCLKLIENTADKLTRVELLQYLVNTQKVNKELTAFTLENLNLPIDKFYKNLEVYNIHFNPEHIENLPLYDALEYIINAFKMTSTSNAYLQFFLDFAFEYANKNLGGITGFIDHWYLNQNSLSIVAPQNQDAVRLLTIHKSKGLEFPVVIFPYANLDTKHVSKDYIWADMPKDYNQIPKAYISTKSNLENLDSSISKPYSTLIKEKQFDIINELYVALTRAKEQLYILTKKDILKEGPNLKTTSGLLIQYLKEQQLWSNANNVYEFGQPHNKISTEEEQGLTAIEQDAFISSSFNTRSITLATNAGRLWGTSIQDAKDEGVLIHNIMAKINTVKDVKTVITQFISSGKLPVERYEDVLKTITSIVCHPELQSYYKKDVVNYNERDMVSETGKILRPDRINIQKDNTAVIIDYKTGVFNAQNEQQIIEYAQTLEAMNYHVSKRILIYTNTTIDIKNV